MKRSLVSYEEYYRELQTQHQENIARLHVPCSALFYFIILLFHFILICFIFTFVFGSLSTYKFPVLG